MKPTGKYDWQKGTWDDEFCWQAPIQEEFLAVIIETDRGRQVMVEYMDYDEVDGCNTLHTRNVRTTIPSKARTKRIEATVDALLAVVKGKIG